jgi:hypothetical protein
MTSGSAGLLTRRDLPHDVFELKERFLWRGRRIGELLDPVLTPAAFCAWTLAPPTIVTEVLAAILSANMAWTGKPPPWPATTEIITDVMRARPACWVVPDSMQTASGSSGRQRPHWGSELVIAGDDCLYIAREPEPGAVKAAWDDAGSAAGMLGVVTTARVPANTATDDDLRALVAAVTHVAVSAYDDSEHLVIFERKP